MIGLARAESLALGRESRVWIYSVPTGLYCSFPNQTLVSSCSLTHCVQWLESRAQQPLPLELPVCPHHHKGKTE